MPADSAVSLQLDSPSSAAAGEPPVAVKLCGVLNLVFGIYGILSTGGSLVFLVVAQSADSDLMGTNSAGNGTLNLGTYHWVSSVGAGLLSVVLILAGVGLLRKRVSGRTLSIGYSVLNLVFLAGSLVFVAIYVVPPAWESLDTLENGQDVGLVATASAGLLGSCFGMIYPICLLICMNLRSVKQCLRS